MPQRTLTTAELKILLMLKSGFRLFEYRNKDGTIGGTYLEKEKTKRYLMRIYLVTLLDEGFLQEKIKTELFAEYELTEKSRELIHA